MRACPKSADPGGKRWKISWGAARLDEGSSAMARAVPAGSVILGIKPDDFD
jgi:hypothetical protein